MVYQRTILSRQEDHRASRVNKRGVWRAIGDHQRGDGLPPGERREGRADVPCPLPAGERVPRRAVELLREDGVVNSAPLHHPEIRGLAPIELPSSFFEKVKDIKLSVPKGSGVYEAKALLDCALWGLDIVDQDYETRADGMLQHQRFCRVVSKQMRLQGFEITDTLRKLYGVT